MLKHIPFYSSLIGRELSSGITAGHSHVLVYGAIEAHSMGEKGCIVSNKYLGKEIGLSEGRISNIISELNKAGWVSVLMDENNHRTGIEPLMTLHASVYPPTRESVPPLHASVNIEHSREHSLEKNIKKEKNFDKDFFVSLLGELGVREAAATPGRKTKLAARLKAFTKEELLQAAKAIRNDKFMQGENDGKKKYGTIDYLLRSDEKVEQWLNAAPKSSIFA